ncbi:enhanced serine sensitivity protein SseB C-terminal domain-containing protein [Yinghuangia seranimata]|uniref:enhanced serine sensitivity protein SseB C-terminal domain-containing protein n=1 Tax=Yinghuangia seranimata TaxID=408067 RepID=UPI00248C3A9C|nr:enhanced serine sensitivity protein SseB C-terminal domain-containing protein [Yinghuangia seranimata]MDI2129375.1 enhanced serine sensitivity protein SseB C-terminal domain-containing protein [Yinghuangia seranimata]
MAFPANYVEQCLVAAMQDASRTGELIDALAEAEVWVPLPAGGGPADTELTLPTTEIGGMPYVPVFSSEEQFRRVAGPMPCTVAPVREFARGLPPHVGLAVNPGGEVGIPIPPEGVLELARMPGAGRMGARVTLAEPSPAEEPYVLLAAAAEEFAVTPVVLTARRALGVVENDAPCLFIGIELDRWQEEDRRAAVGALERAVGRTGAPWPVSLVLIDLAQDPIGDWMLDSVRPFYERP